MNLDCAICANVEEVRMPDCNSETGVPRGISKVKVYFNYTCLCTSRKPDAMSSLSPICMSHSHTNMSFLNHIIQKRRSKIGQICALTLLQIGKLSDGMR